MFELRVLLVQRAGMPRDGVRAQRCALTIKTQAPDECFLQTTLLVDVFTALKAFYEDQFQVTLLLILCASSP